MVATDKVFAGSIPEIYDRFLVPLIFEPYATDLASGSPALKPQHVLETAAGTGVLTRAMASRLAGRAHRRDRSQPADARSGGGAAGRAIAGSPGGRPMRCRCRSRIERSTPWSASSA